MLVSDLDNILQNTVTIRAPGKLILSGEHAVVYGNPALAIAIDKHINIKISANNYAKYLVKITHIRHKFSFDYIDLLQIKYDKILNQPINLIQYAIILILDALKLPKSMVSKLGLEFVIQSNLPIGAGLGSSAALIIGIMLAMLKFFDAHIEQEQLLNLARAAEDLQHGKSSGLDLFMSLNGGLCRYEKINLLANFQSLNLPNDWQLFMIHTGKPKSSTGDCVRAVKAHMNEQKLAEFAAVTNNMQAAIQAKDLVGFKDAINFNHQLLCRIKVVPDKIRNFIFKLNQNSIAAKVCGAGAINGHAAGVILAVGLQEQDIIKIQNHDGYQVSSVLIDKFGAVEAGE